MVAITATPLTGTMGAELSGFELSEGVTDDLAAGIKAALLDHQVIMMRQQASMDHQTQLKLARHFGELHVHPAHEHPGEDPSLVRIHTDESSTRNNGGGWHTDVSCEVEPPLGTILQLQTVPPAGGDTLFSSMYAAYDGLSPAMADFLSGLTAHHTGAHVYTHEQYRDDATFPEADHPIVRTHPDTGRRALYINRAFTTRINGVSRSESQTLLGFLFDHIEQAAYQCRVKWEPHTVVMWDNRAVLHYAVWDYYPNTRSGWRVTIKGDQPFFDADASAEPMSSTAPPREPARL